MSADDAAKALSAAYKTAAGSVPSAKILGLLIGQWATETANGAAIHNYNYGNVKHSSADQYYQEFSGSEVVDGQNVVSVMQFAAYPNAEAGAVAFIKQLQKRPQWWAGLQTGDPQKYVASLVAVAGQHYFTADPNTYLKALISRMNTYASVVKKYASSRFKNFLQIAFGLAVGATGVYAYRNRQSIVRGMTIVSQRIKQ